MSLTSNQMQQLREQIELMSPEQREALIIQTHIYRILVSMYKTQSMDRDVLVNDIIMHYNGNVPTPLIENVVDNYLIHIINDDEYVVNGQLTELAVNIAQMHDAMTSYQDTPKTLH